jgi:glucose-6-phosphate 1-epimerase
MDIQGLNARFAIAGKVAVIEGDGGFPMVAVTTPAASALVSVYAGQVLSFRPAGAEDLFFLSDKAFYADGKAIKGGVPICWPWFGPDPDGKGRPGHGFVRNRMWTLRGVEELPDGRIHIRVGLADSEETRAIWPHGFDVELQATIGESLETALVTRNTGTTPFSLSQGLHTYFKVGDASRATVEGLDGVSYVDKMDGGAVKTLAGPVTITGETEMLVTGAPAAMEINDPAMGRAIRIRSQGSASAVIWNPWAKTGGAMADLEPEDYLRLLCVETTNAGPDTVTVPPGGVHRLAAVYSLG